MFDPNINLLQSITSSVMFVNEGVAVGSGRQSTVAYVNIVCYYVIGVPLGAVLGYVAKLQVKVTTLCIDTN